MRIWIVNQYAVPPSRPGPPRHHNLARELIRRGHQVRIVAGDFDHHGDRDAGRAPSRPPGEVDGVPYLWLRVRPYRGNSVDRVLSMVAFGTSVRALARRGLERPDVIVGSSPHLFGALGAQRLARRLGVPFVLEVRDLWPDSLVALGGYAEGHPVVRALARIERHLYRAAAGIVAVLPGTIEPMTARGARRDRIALVPNGVALDTLPPPAPPPEHDGFTVAYAGSHGIANALDAVLDAAARLQRTPGQEAVRFELIGDGVEKPRLEARARREGLRNVVFSPAVPKDRLYERLARADAFVVSSLPTPLYRHGVSFNKFFDYLALARPVVVGLDAFNDPVAEARAGHTVAPGDGAAMAEAIVRLRGLPAEERWRMGLRGRRYVERHHDVGVLGAKLEALLGAVVEPVPAAGGAARHPQGHS